MANEWATEKATELADEVFDACVDSYEGVASAADYTAMITRALIEAEARGAERFKAGIEALKAARDQWNEKQNKAAFEVLGLAIDAMLSAAQVKP